MTPIVFAVSIIQLPSRKGARYGFNVPNCYLKTKAKYEQDNKYFSNLLNKVYQKPCHSFRLLPNVSMEYCSMSIVKTLLMYKVCITKRPREIWQCLTDFWIKKNDILRLFECLELSESTACYWGAIALSYPPPPYCYWWLIMKKRGWKLHRSPNSNPRGVRKCNSAKSRCDRIVALYILLKRLFQPMQMQMQRRGPIIWAKPKWTSFDIYTRFSLSTSASQTRVMGFIFCATVIFTYRDMQMQ